MSNSEYNSDYNSDTSPPSYNNQNNNTYYGRTSRLVKKISNTLSKKMGYNKKLDVFNTKIKNKYKKSTPGFICQYYVIDKIRLLLQHKFNSTITKHESKLLRNLQKNLDKFIELDIQLQTITKEQTIIIKKIKELENSRDLLVRMIKLIILEYDNAVKEMDKLMINKYKKKGIKHNELLKDLINQLKPLKKTHSSNSNKMRSIYEKITKMLKMGGILISPSGDHFLNDTNFLNPSIDLYFNTSKTHKFYTQKPPNYNNSQKNIKLSRKMTNKWKAKTFKEDYYTANELNSNNDTFFSANNNLNNNLKIQKRKKKSNKKKLLKKLR